jgi:hypothetical protein
MMINWEHGGIVFCSLWQCVALLADADLSEEHFQENSDNGANLLIWSVGISLQVYTVSKYKSKQSEQVEGKLTNGIFFIGNVLSHSLLILLFKRSSQFRFRLKIFQDLCSLLLGGFMKMEHSKI